MIIAELGQRCHLFNGRQTPEELPDDAACAGLMILIVCDCDTAESYLCPQHTIIEMGEMGLCR